MKRQGRTSGREPNNILTKLIRGARVLFEPKDWVWFPMRKEQFSAQRHSKLLPRGDGLFLMIEKINDNTYKLDILGEYNVRASFNIVDLSPFDVSEDSRTNPFQEKGNYENQVANFVRSVKHPWRSNDKDKNQENEGNIKQISGAHLKFMSCSRH